MRQERELQDSSLSVILSAGVGGDPLTKGPVWVQAGDGGWPEYGQRPAIFPGPAVLLLHSVFFDYGGDGHQGKALTCPQRFPMELWTFTDAVDNHAILPPFLDEDGSGVRDLGDTWSTPVIGQIALCAPGASACDPDDPDYLARVEQAEQLASWGADQARRCKGAML